MQRRSYRITMWLLILLTGSVLTQFGPAGSCFSFGVDNTLAGTNFCFIFDCQNGFLGGLIQPCGSPLDSRDDIFQDCPAPVVITTN